MCPNGRAGIQTRHSGCKIYTERKKSVTEALCMHMFVCILACTEKLTHRHQCVTICAHCEHVGVHVCVSLCILVLLYWERKVARVESAESQAMF